MKKTLFVALSLLIICGLYAQPQFRSGSAVLTPELKEYLNQFSQKHTTYVVYGTADNTGSVKTNHKLAILRSNTAVMYLLSLGVEAQTGGLVGLRYPVRTIVVESYAKQYELQTIQQDSPVDLVPLSKRIEYLEEQNRRLMFARKDTVILTDSSFIANVYWSIGGSGVVNMLSRDPLYGGGAETQINFPAFNGTMRLFGSFRDEVTVTAGLNYMWQVANLSNVELFLQVGALYVSYPVVDLPARKWIGLAIGSTAALPIEGFGWLKVSIDALPNIELHTDPVNKNISFGSIGLSLYPSVSLAFRVN